MNASLIPRMGLEHEPVPEWRLARHALYHHAGRRAAARRTAVALLPGPERPQPGLHGDDAPARVVHRLLQALLAVRRLLVAGHRPQPRDCPPGRPQGAED